MFRHRLLTTLVLLPCILAVIFFAERWIFASVLVLFVAVGAWEWLKLIPLRRPMSRVGFLVLLALLILASFFWAGLPLPWLFPAYGLLWLCILVAIVSFPASQVIWGRKLIVALAGLCLLPLFVSSMLALLQQAQGRNLIFYLLCLVWASDIGAYLVGKFCGRHKLIPKVSPGKTIEGSLGGLLLALLVAEVAAVAFQRSPSFNWFVLALAVTITAMLGDLFMSMLKRRCQIKDTGQIFPGHGGVLDRIDSLIAAAPLFYSGLPYFGL
jgi:phosphatidate cytidylyltransferase